MSTNKNKQQRINQVSRNASLPHPDIYRDKPDRTRAAKPYLHFVRSLSHASGKVRYALAAAQAHIVLPDFTQSLSADGEEELLCLIANSINY